MKDVAILLLNWNGLEYTKACIESIIKNTHSTDYDILVLDNGSKNNEYESLEVFYKERNNVQIYSSEENLGFTGGNNFLIKKAKDSGPYKYYFLLNNDTEIEDATIDEFLSGVAGRDGIFGPQVRYFENKELMQSVGGKINYWTGICPRIGDKLETKIFKEKDKEALRDYIFGCAFLISGQAVEKLGFLEEDYFIYYEEVDYCVRAKAAGFMVSYIPKGIVYHKDSVSTRKVSGFHIYMMFRNRIRFLRKWASGMQFLFSFLYLSLYLPYFTLKYGIKEASFLFKGTLDGLRGKTGNPMKYGMFR